MTDSTSPIATPELLPCPFCGKQGITVFPDEYGSGGQHVPPYHVACDITKKGCGVSVMEDDEADAIATWNRRASPPATKLVPLTELASIQKLALAGEQGEVDPWAALGEIASRLGHVAASPPAPAAPSIAGWVVALQTVVELPGKRPELGYTVLADAEPFDSTKAASAYIRANSLPLGWVIMQTDQPPWSEFFRASPPGVAAPAQPSRTDLEWFRLPEVFAKFVDYAERPVDENALRIIKAVSERVAAPAIQALDDDDLHDLYYELKAKEGDTFRDTEEELAAVDWFKHGYRAAIDAARSTTPGDKA